MESDKNKNHWDKMNVNYSRAWQSKAKQEMSQRELGFINKYLTDYLPRTILDIGVGNGRILDNIVKNSRGQSQIFGLDISENMVNICREKFKNESAVKKIEVCDISREEICFDDNFDLITAIRVLQYNKNWAEILERIFRKLVKGGVCIFTMPNSHSITALRKDTFSEHKIPIRYANKKRMEKILAGIGYRVIEARGFSKIPNIFYDINDNYFYVKSLLRSEKFLEKIFGKSLLSRVLFFACLRE